MLSSAHADTSSRKEEGLNYRALDRSKREIRLLKVLSPRFPEPKTTETGTVDAQVRCTLQYASLDDNTDYNALSYAWGDPNKTVTILVDDCIFHATENLESALRHVQASESESLWIDAVCINQRNDAEKSSQVQMMGSIYERAKTVIIWLGPEREHSGPAMKLTEELGDHAMLLNELQRQTSNLGDPALVHKLNTQILDLFLQLDRFSWITLMTDLLNRAWWRRLWVLQELLLAKNAIMACGFHTAPWLKFSAILNLMVDLSMAEWDTGNFDRSIAATDIVRHALPMIITERSFRQSEGEGLSLKRTSESNLDELQCTDPRDRLYGFLGLLRKSEQTKLLVDYSKTCSEVFSLTAKALFPDHGPDILSLCQTTGSSRRIVLPSWVPDWTNRIIIPLHHHKDMLFNASGTSGKEIFSVQQYPGTAASGVLPLPGVLVDVIYKVGSELDQRVGRNDYDQMANTLKVWIKEMENLLPEKHRYEAPKDLSEALYMTPYAGVSLNIQRLEILEEPEIQFLEQIHHETTEEDPERTQWKLQIIKYASAMHADDRRAFSSRNGFLGLGPKRAEPGDMICIFMGGQTPYIIRRGEGGRYRLIGDAYVHGIMDGEFMEQDPEIERIELY